MDSVRKPYQGVWNIVRFNWHYYLLSIGGVVAAMLLRGKLSAQIRTASDIGVLLVVSSTFISLIVSYYIYDCSPLYRFSWLDNLADSEEKIVNINAGFDETSRLLKLKFSQAKLLVIDFYNPETHTEVSIKRARKAYPAFLGTQLVSTSYLPTDSMSVDKIFAILSAHEIRDDNERIIFFREIERVLKVTGQVIVTEHLRDTANFLAYNIGFLHFHSRAIWLKTFRASGLRVVKEIKITPFITSFILQKNGTTY